MRHRRLSYDRWLSEHQEKLKSLFHKVLLMVADKPLLDNDDDVFDKFCKFMYRKSSKRTAEF